PLKSPTSFVALGVADQPGKLATALLVMAKVFVAVANATGIDAHDGPVSTMSLRPSPLKSPSRAIALVFLAQLAKLPTGRSSTAKCPPREERATGIVVQVNPAPAMRATSARPSASKSPTSFCVGCAAQVGNWPTDWFVIVKVPSPLADAKATGTLLQSLPPTS